MSLLKIERLQRITDAVRGSMRITPIAEVENPTVPWENKFAKGLEEIGMERRLKASVRWKNNKKEKRKELVCTLGEEVVSLTREITGRNVGEKDGSFFYTVQQKDFDNYDWLQIALRKNPIELYGINENGERSPIQLKEVA